jgi:hypothetical protein
MRKRLKFGNKKTLVRGFLFDSKKEAARFIALSAMQDKGEINGLKLQPAYELAPSVKFKSSKRKKPALRYFADFSYFDVDGNLVVEDSKGRETDVFKIKRHLMLSVLGIDILVT